MFDDVDEDVSFLESKIDDYNDLCNLADAKNDENRLEDYFNNMEGLK